MGTRSLTILYDNPWDEGEEPTEIAVLYRQFDGYVSGHGHELADFLAGKSIVNGLGERDPALANGGACLAAQVVSYFKVEPGAVYLHAAGTRDIGEEYRYHVYPQRIPTGLGMRAGILVKVERGYGDEWETIFDGSAGDLSSFEE